MLAVDIGLTVPDPSAFDPSAFGPFVQGLAQILQAGLARLAQRFVQLAVQPLACLMR